MVHVGMHAAIGKKSEQVEAPAPTSCVLHGCEKHVAREELAILDHQLDTGAVHVDDTAGADIKMSHFTVPHLTVGQANIFPAGMDECVGVFAEQAIVGRLARERDSVGFRLGAITPTVENDKDQWFRTGHRAAIDYPVLLAVLAGVSFLIFFPSSLFCFFPSFLPFFFLFLPWKVAWIPRLLPP